MTKTERDIKGQIGSMRERLKTLSGFWIGEGAAVIYALEWVIGKRENPPSEEIGKTGGDYERVAANLVKLVEKAASARASRPRAVVARRPRPGKK